jgi:hypothetical protein
VVVETAYTNPIFVAMTEVATINRAAWNAGLST